MGYRIHTGRTLKTVTPQGLGAVRSAIRKRTDGVALAMAFDPGSVHDLALNAHASAMMTGLLYARGWRRAGQEVRIGNAAEWPDRWWRDTPGPGAFVVETALSPDARCEVDDLATIMSLTAVAWCMELEVRERERPTPDLMTATVPEGVSLASVHHEPWGDAVRESLDAVMARMGERPQARGSRSHAYAQMHLEGSSVEPWSLPDRPCVFATAMSDPHCKRVFVALSNTAGGPNPETMSGLLRLMLASGADD